MAYVHGCHPFQFFFLVLSFLSLSLSFSLSLFLSFSLSLFLSFSLFVSPALTQDALDYTFNTGGSVQPMRADTKELLDALYCESNRELQRMLGGTKLPKYSCMT